MASTAVIIGVLAPAAAKSGGIVFFKSKLPGSIYVLQLTGLFTNISQNLHFVRR